MTEAEELFATFQKFWRSGKNARLNVKCHAGKVWASLHVSINLSQPSPHQKRSSPSRLRRRARRAATRAQAAGQAVDASEVIPVDNSKDDETVDPFEQEGAKKLHTVAQTVLSDNQAQRKAVQAGPTPNGSVDDSAEDVVEVDEEVLHPISKLNVLARPWPSEQQVDIHRGNKSIVRVPSNQCEKCGKTFGSNRALRNHVTKEHTSAGSITNDII